MSSCHNYKESLVYLSFINTEELSKPYKLTLLIFYNTFPYPIQKAKELENLCKQGQLKISELVLKNEKSLRKETEIDFEIKRLWDTMLECLYTGCHTKGILHGDLNVKRRAFDTKFPLDKVIESMYENAKDMNSKHKKTSEEGLAVSVNITDC